MRLRPNINTDTRIACLLDFCVYFSLSRCLIRVHVLQSLSASRSRSLSPPYVYVCAQWLGMYACLCLFRLNGVVVRRICALTFIPLQIGLTHSLLCGCHVFFSLCVNKVNREGKNRSLPKKQKQKQLRKYYQKVSFNSILINLFIIFFRLDFAFFQRTLAYRCPKSKSTTKTKNPQMGAQSQEIPQ